PLVDDLALNYLGTDPNQGTDVYNLYYGLQRYLYDHHLYDDYLVTLAISPTVEWVVDEVRRSEDVILLLGFWQWHQEAGGVGEWVRFGGHYVTVAGVDTEANRIAFSDPFVDNAELGGAGRWLSGMLWPHVPVPGHPPEVHNDAGNISHDMYMMAPDSPSPGGVWWLPEYLNQDPVNFLNFVGVNPHPLYPFGDWHPEHNVHVEVEYAIAMSPFRWKNGEWLDYAPSCMPDFDQRQDLWRDPAGGGKWTYCGPAAVANSLWWFDSKFEPSPVPPPVYNDHYPLVKSYDPAGAWDDHDPRNVESQAPTIEFVDDLAGYMGTGTVSPGTIISDVVQGTVDYMTDHDLIEDYTVTLVHQPDWDWVVYEVTRCEDVVLLLGFWIYDNPYWYRLGGHYVTVAGVDPVTGLVGFADPYLDQAELGWPWLGRVFPPGAHPPHPGMIPDIVHNDARFLSHDVYHVAPSPSPGGLWGPREYPAAAIIGNFEMQNGPWFTPVPGLPPPPDPSRIYTEAEWAMAVSPRPPDLVLTKEVTPTTPLLPGGWVTYTLAYSNVASPHTYHVVISDALPVELVYPSLVCTTTYGTPIVVSGTYILNIGRVSYHEGGVCTIRAQVDPALTYTLHTFGNEARIETTTPERDLSNNQGQVYVTVHTADVWADKEGPAQVRAGKPLTYTVHYGNDGPAGAEGVVLTDIFPDGTSYVDDSSGLVGAAIAGGRQWTVGPLASGASATFVLTLSLPADTVAGTLLTDTLIIDTPTPQSLTGNDEDQVETKVITLLWLPLILKGS
ncbi:MAG: DUF11 domain-containing protein, partial [Chloroflexi bacterium]|nr:DUF11 domain-containing protein [Chloroflexota bacterium]